jgi:hypothetical protein
MTDHPNVIAALSAVMTDVHAVGKTGRNEAQKYSFRGIDAVMNAVGPALRTHGVVIVPNVEEANYREVEVGQKRTLQRECTVRVRYRFHGPAGPEDFIECTVYGEALDSGDKATAKAHSVAYRTALLQALTIPTDELDPDEHTAERSARPEPEPVDPRVSRDNAEALIAKCGDLGLTPSEVVKLGTEGRTDDPYEVHKTEVGAVKQAMDLLTPADGEQVPE